MCPDFPHISTFLSSAMSRLESVWARVSVGRNRAILFASLYRPPSAPGTQLGADLDQLESELEFMLSQHRGLVVICADTNCDMRYTTGNTTGAHLSSLLQKFQLDQIIDSPTFRSSGTIIDIIATNDRTSVVARGVQHCHFSPHDFARALFRVSKCRPVPAIREGRNWKAIDLDMFCADLVSRNWSPVFDTDNVAFQTDYFIQNVTGALDVHAPIRRVKMRSARPPPLSDDTKRLMAERRAALRGPDRELYVQLNSQVRLAMQRDARDSIGRRIAEAGRGSMYRCIRPIIQGKSGGSQQRPDVSPDRLNRYFSEIGVNTAASVAATLSAGGASELPVRLPRVVTAAFRVQPVTPDELCLTVQSMNGSNACGPDGLPMHFVKKCFHALSHVILCMVNTSLVTGIVPDSWKLATIQPIYKGSGSTSDPSSFRPISLVPCLAKITERVVHKQLSGYLDSHHLLADTQHGFRRFHSTETALLAVTDSVMEAMDQGKISLLVLLDLSKCFDVIDHGKLLQKLELYGIDITWFRSYLSNHQQHVRLSPGASTPLLQGTRRQHRAHGDNVSDTLPNPIGVYQGTCLGPLLFNLASNDLSLYIDSSVKIIQYADDSQLLISGKKSELPRLIQEIESAMRILHQWFSQNHMKLNMAKTQLLVLGSPQILRGMSKVTLSVEGSVIHESDTVKNLGLVMDRNMNYNAHVSQVCRRCTGVLIGLSHVRHSIPRKALPTLVSSLVISLIRYCLSIYGSCTKRNVMKLQRVVNFGARVVAGRRKRDHVSDVLKDLQWLSVPQLQSYHALCLLKRLLTNSEPRSLAQKLVRRRDVRRTQTRQDDQLDIPAIKTEWGRRRFFYRTVDAFNRLPSRIAAGRIRAFKRRLCKHLRDADCG